MTTTDDFKYSEGDPYEDDRSLGLCASCYTMKNLRNGEIRCDSCMAVGGPTVEYDPYLDDESEPDDE